VPVLSKQHISTFPANGILKGSVQNTSKKDILGKHLNPEFRVFVLTVLYNQILNGLFSKCIYNPCGLKLH
jgi:hypothetical protein